MAITIAARPAARGALQAPLRLTLTRLCSQQRGFSDQKTVGIVGAGVAGLQAARALEAEGFKTKIFESTGNVGGVWQSNYAKFGLQVPKQLFEFPDFPFTKAKWGEYASGPKVQEYIEDYAKHFDLNKLVKLNTKVTSIVPDNGGWTFTTKTGESDTTESFDYCIVATGMYGRPYKPEFEGQDKFAGKMYHSSEFTSLEGLEGKHLVVVGNGKSAVDCAVNSADAGAKVTLLSRKAHWPTPRYIANLIEFQYIFLSRLGQALVVGHKGTLPEYSPPHMKLWHKLGWPVMAGAFKVVEALFAAQFGQLNSSKMSPWMKNDVVEDFYGYAQVMDYSLRDAVKAGKVDWKQGAVSEFTETSLKVGDEEIKADVVVFGTGFLKTYDYFPEEVREKLGKEADGLYLYKHMLPSKVPNLAFVGGEIATISNIMTYSVQGAWLAKVWNGEIPLPPAEKMDETIEATKAWKRGWMSNTFSRANLVLLHQIHYHDGLMKDMGLPHFRKAPNYLAEAFMPYQAGDYDGVVKKVA
mmetsp:Transcript_22010/g.48088  ORF Transcript_22010/g.48088 Transcript_22010/m.48088 type:complete len:524 (-) Transcript_22010:536-2107(-)|eukprot:CAMPEP_0206447244 /NCGR_PEP_ID=MMETSP0324_2-20121206/16662_1 /ASSEMBLY_ACC=CAM_ASM_000836 /TAXON_ID=2866 /ORGANISM="Crypthecodinium cohnii, Strain Seligo" /LENGTH=523 /DNA_ID=CAMNT_0053915961 /DNA_START=37 /DNA_END=1608 /DNA_ORIENTATION=+